MAVALEVSLFGRHAGRVSVHGDLGSPEDWTFAYDAAFLARSDAAALSVSLPLRREPHVGAVVRNWFCNLLPEGAVRDAITRRLRIPERDDFALLAAIGHECAGAVSVHRVDATPPSAASAGADLEELVCRQGDGQGGGTWALLAEPLRLSLAGAQDKIAVVRADDGRLRLPRADQPSTHILKRDSLQFRGLRDLEALGLALARAIGLDAARAEPVAVAGRAALLVERFDRATGTDGKTRRLHQEDFCQALGYPGELKYESQGGPGLAACSALVRRLGLGPSSVRGLLDGVLFNALIGNADAHAKNLALLCGEDGRLRLAPLYDLVPTVALPESMVERTPALRIGQARRIDAIAAADWRVFARECGYAPGYVQRRLATLGEAIRAQLPAVTAMLVRQGCDEARLARAAAVIERSTG